ncbi:MULTISPECIES: serine/threonine-protein kinase [Candidatus Accumulibacter]|uniref:non-specific serine/threonine protein kinase n=1 Tax=Candidatus Accumulibacter phosphatis TaxID=327160 RepID=A0A5S4FCM8_9PROT|nr:MULTISPECIES: serine/threonine-protein kinase [Candidatus Accumulibacter]MBL8401347.1 protein kinase [Accumulibacter sp.]TMQ78633.1 Serine/threonine-protein kinase PknB [Candidatus Accumulibacter phosphatis]
MGNQVIGDFELVAKIGEGGMGEVFKGRDPMLERDVAIKSLRPEFAARADILERFRTEAVALARLNHPNIAGVYRFFRHADQYYMVMEFVAGETLDQLVVRRGALPWQEAIRYGIAALNGLEHAHRAGVVHRDIKPANMMVAVDGSLKLMDFGIARILEKMRLTRSGHLIGTLEYMSPEQVQGRDVDARSDLYSLAVVLFELLTGRVPFSKGTDFEIMKAQIEEPPPPLRQFAGSLPVVLENILSRALAKDPAQRYPDASAFRNALEGALSGHLPPPDAAPHPVPATRLFAPQDAISTAADIGRSASVAEPETARIAADANRETMGASPGLALWKKYPGILALLVALLMLGGLGWWSSSKKTPASPAEASSGLVQKPPAGATTAPSLPRSEPAAAATVNASTLREPMLPASTLQSVPTEVGTPATIPAPPPDPVARPTTASRERASPDSGEKVAVTSKVKEAPSPRANIRSDRNPPVVKRDDSGSAGGWTIRK